MKALVKYVFGLKNPWTKNNYREEENTRQELVHFWMIKLVISPMKSKMKAL